MRRILILCAALLLVVGCVREITRLKEQAAQVPTSENYLALGIQQLKAKDYEAAVESFHRSLKLDPSSPKTHHNLGVAYVRLGRDQDALREFRLSHNLKPDYQKFLVPLNSVGIPTEPRSLGELRQSAVSRPNDIQAAFALAQGYQRAALLEEAVAQYRKVAARSPRHAGVQYGLGSTLAQLGRYDEAKGPLLRAIRLKPSWATPHFTLGLIHLASGDVEDAFGEYQVLQQIDVNLADKLFARIYE